MSKTRVLHTPGEPEPAAGDDAQAGAPDAAAFDDDSGPAAQDKPKKAPSMADVLARLEALEVENKALKAATGPAPDAVVYVPETKHGKERLAASEYATMTVGELLKAIDEGKAAELPPSTSALCRDGYYCSRQRIPA